MRRGLGVSLRSISTLGKAVILIVVILLASITAYYVASVRGASPASTSSTATEVQPFILSLDPPELLIAPGLNESYATLNIEPITSGTNISLSLSSTASSGLELAISQSNVTYNPSVTASIPIVFSASTEIQPGTYNTTISAQSSSGTVTQSFPIKVVPDLVVMDHESFIPSNITVPVGTTVVWMNIDTEIGCCDPGFHTVTFLSPTNATEMGSTVLHRFDVWSFEFTSPGTYHYICTIHPNMHGTVYVTA